MKKALYEAVLRDVDRYEELARRAEGFADDELAGFFRGISDENQRRAVQGQSAASGGRRCPLVG